MPHVRSRKTLLLSAATSSYAAQLTAIALAHAEPYDSSTLASGSSALASSNSCKQQQQLTRAKSPLPVGIGFLAVHLSVVASYISTVSSGVVKPTTLLNPPMQYACCEFGAIQHDKSPLP
jgi:hypothetical protein